MRPTQDGVSRRDLLKKAALGALPMILAPRRTWASQENDQMADVRAKSQGGPGQDWGPRLHLTSGWLGAGGIRVMATEGDTVHLLVWDDAVHYLRSEDAGATWGPKTRLAGISGAQAHPSIHRSGSKLHVFWQDGRDGTGEPYSWRICYKRSDDGGHTWGPDVRISSREAKSFRHASTVSGQAVHEVWADKRHNTVPNAFSTDGNWEIYYKRSLDGGDTWGPDVRLTRTGMTCQRPAIGADGDTVLVAYLGWKDRGLGTLNAAATDIYTIRSTDGGETWGPSVQMTDTPTYQSWHPQLVTPGPDTFGMLWESGRRYDFDAKVWTGRSRMLFRRSTDGGETWHDEQQVSDGPDSTHSLVYGVGAQVHATWTDRLDGKRDGKNAAFYAFSPDGGLTWRPPECLTPDGGWNAGPPGATDRCAIVTMQPEGKTEVYYRRRAVPR